jgi:hypothetical protein
MPSDAANDRYLIRRVKKRLGCGLLLFIKLEQPPEIRCRYRKADGSVVAIDAFGAFAKSQDCTVRNLTVTPTTGYALASQTPYHETVRNR